MNVIANGLKMLYKRNKLFFVATLIVVLVFAVGCATQGAPPPSGPVGGGC